jgi:hypothetical protein
MAYVHIERARIIPQLRNGNDWLQLLQGHVDAIQLKEFATPHECAQLVALVRGHPRAVQYNSAAGIVRLGSSLSDIRKSRDFDEYSNPDILSETLAVNGAMARLIGTVAASWPYGLETFSYQSFALHRSIGRRIVDAGAEPHADNIAIEIPDEPLASTVQSQLGANLYIEVPEQGGELEGWHMKLNSNEYDSLRNPDPKLNYGIRRDVLEDSDWLIKPGLGDVVIFRNDEIHGIRKSEGARTTWGFFLGYRRPAAPLLIWS